MERLGYQLLGFAVWNGGKWYLRRRYGDAPRRIAAAGVVAALLAGLVLGGRRLAGDE